MDTYPTHTVEDDLLYFYNNLFKIDVALKLLIEKATY